MTLIWSWGRHRPARPAAALPWGDRDAPLPVQPGRSLLAHGLGRSYGDVAFNDDGAMLMTRRMDRFIAFDRATGRLRAEAGVSLAEILAVAVPVGWFLPVTPGTRFVTLGGAVANDVHGKNHHGAGSFGHHVTALELLRSDGSRTECTPVQHAELLRATIGGLGLTGLITWVEIQLVPIANPWMWGANVRFGSLDEYWAVDAELGRQFPYAVAWVDCLHGGRGIYSAAAHAGVTASGPSAGGRPLSMPLTPPVSLVNGLTLRLFNAAYYRRRIVRQGLMHLLPFFYPLDGIGQWNRMYGRRGFFQYQCALPPAAMKAAAADLFRLIGRSGQGSFLAVFKTFGDRPPAGLLSFPRPGATLALDFPNRGEATRRLFREMDAVVAAADGALYPAKDACMPPSLFRAGYAQLAEFTRFVDPAFSSSFWRRVVA
jgi:FAD/FMN-containing dehydrogenase